MSDRRSLDRGMSEISRARFQVRKARGDAAAVAAVEPLEERWMLATFVVTSNSDVPVVMGMTLRQAILLANATPGADTITFNIAGTPTIHPLTALPAVTGPTT